MTVRAFGASERFQSDNSKRLDTHNHSQFTLWVLFRWGSVRIGVINAILAAACAYFLVGGKGTIEAALAGASLSFVLSLGTLFGFAVNSFTGTSAISCWD